MSQPLKHRVGRDLTIPDQSFERGEGKERYEDKKPHSADAKPRYEGKKSFTDKPKFKDKAKFKPKFKSDGGDFKSNKASRDKAK